MPSPILAYSPIQETVAELRADCVSFERLIESLFDEIERLSGELEQRAWELAGQREQVGRREKQLADQRAQVDSVATQIERQESQLSLVLSELKDVKGQLGLRPDQVDSGQGLLDPVAAQQPLCDGDDTRLTSRVTQLENERDALQRELDEVRRNNSELTEAISLQQLEVADQQGRMAAELKRLSDLLDGRLQHQA